MAAAWGTGCATQRTGTSPPSRLEATESRPSGSLAAKPPDTQLPVATATNETRIAKQAPPAGYAWDAGFLASSGTDLHGNARLRALGPIFESRVGPDGERFLAVRPFYSRLDEPREERTIHESLWPVFISKDFKSERFWRCLVIYGHDFDRFTPGSRYRFVAFPFVFTGRNASGDPYFALFPVGGKIYDFLTRDKIVFALFPLYAYSTINDQKTHSVLWPLGSYTRGEGVLRYRVVPLYGRSEYKNRWTKSFVLWPVWTDVEYNYKTSKGSGYILFPLYGHIKLSDQETWMFLPPFFRWTRGEKADKLHAPWPFVQYSAGVSDRKVLWPLWGRKKQGTTDSWFSLWPFLWGSTNGDSQDSVRQFRLMPLVHYRSRIERAAAPATEQERIANPEEANAPKPAATQESPGIVSERYLQLWPLGSYLREGSNAVVRALDLWPIKRLNPIERNYAPFWTLYSRERRGGEVWHEALWGLYRQGRDENGLRHWSLFPLATIQRTPEEAGKSVSCLLGLIRYDRKGMDRRWRLLYFLRFGGHQAAQKEASTP